MAPQRNKPHAATSKRDSARGPEAFLRRAESQPSASKKKAALSASGTLELPQRIHAELSRSALVSNYRALRDLAAAGSRSKVHAPFLLPMLKADAYGHGAEWVARALQDESGLWGFGVATLEEGIALRRSLAASRRSGPPVRVVVVSGGMPWGDAAAEACQSFGLTATIASEEDFRAFLKRGDAGRIRYELFFNTGMNRLGIPPAFAREIVRALRDLPTEAHPEGVFSHLADAENPASRVSQAQMGMWRDVRAQLSSVLPSALFHVGNSSALWNARHWDLESTDVVRPGLSLYGIAPWKDAPVRGLQPVLRLRAPILQVHRLKPGDSIGYGATYTVKGDAAVHAAILDAGYADGVQRRWSGRGEAHFVTSGGRGRFVGVVSMDLCAVSCPPSAKPGDWVELWGPAIDPWVQAQHAETIPYEIMTSFSKRVKRVVVDSFS